MFKLHHIDIWISNIEESIKFYETIGFRKIGDIDYKERDKRIILMQLDDLLLEMKSHYKKQCNHNTVNCEDNKVFGLSVENINEAKKVIENEKLTTDEIIIQKGILGQLYFMIHDPNGILIEFIEEKH